MVRMAFIFHVCALKNIYWKWLSAEGVVEVFNLKDILKSVDVWTQKMALHVLAHVIEFPAGKVFINAISKWYWVAIISSVRKQISYSNLHINKSLKFLDIKDLVLFSTATKTVIPDIHTLGFVERVILGLPDAEEWKETIVSDEVLIKFWVAAVVLIDHLAIGIHLALKHFMEFSNDVYKGDNVTNQWQSSSKYWSMISRESFHISFFVPRRHKSLNWLRKRIDFFQKFKIFHFYLKNL